MRINKYLALAGVASRRKSDELVINGKVKINGKLITELGYDVKNKDVVEVDGKPIKLAEKYVYYKLNKPKGYICSASDEKGRKTIYNLLGNIKERVFYIGRLDYNTEGLLLLTNDGDLANKISHPSNEIEKEYTVVIEGTIKESECAVLRAGVIENGERMPSAKVDVVALEKGKTRLSVKIDEGQNRQIRRMFKCIGKEIILLKRVRIGEILLGGLSRGECKELTDAELAYLNKILRS